MGIHRILHEMYEAGYAKYITASAQSISCIQWGEVFEVTTTGTADTLTLLAPTKPGIVCAVVLSVDAGDLTLTVTDGYHADGDTSITFSDAGDYVVLHSIQVGTSYYWRVLADKGTNVNDLTVTAGAGITAAADNIASSVEKVGSLYKTTIVIDVDGLESSTTEDDIIGGNDLADCHLGQITAARSGTIFAGTIECIEAPTGGVADIDLYSAVEDSGTENAAVTGLDETALLTAAAVWAAGDIRPLTAYPAADEYLYLAVGVAGTAATYTAGILKIELWGN